jgi:NAD(P)H-dependent FMN reductase
VSKILILSATNDKNLELAKDLQQILSDMDFSTDIICLEDLGLPLFNSNVLVDEIHLDSLLKKMKESEGLIFCSPEYNGGVPPVLSNAITWVTVKSENWREAFIGKFSIISSYSGGDAHRFISAFRSQLEYMGTNVLARSISVSKNKPLDTESAKRIFQGLIDIIN